MIGTITKGSGFGGVFAYILGEEKGAVLLKEAQQCFSNTPEDLAREFQYIANSRYRTTEPVRHFSIGFAPEDGKIELDIKAEIAVRIMEEMGFGDCQYFAVAHGRVVDNHHEIHAHDHIHIVANAIKPNGEKVDHFWDYRKLERCLREIEVDYKFRQVPNSWELPKVSKIAELTELQSKIDKALENSLSLKEWIDRIETSGVNVRFRITSRGCVQGIGYVHDGKINKGGDVDRSWKLLSSRFEQTPENLELMRSANLRTQSLSVELKPEDQALLTKAADLAMQKLAGEDKFKDKSVQISIVDDVLKVRRLRPNKIVLTAKKDSDGKWRSIGMPNIDAKKDLQILGDVGNKKESEVLDDLAKVDVVKANEVSKRPRKVKVHRRSNELE
jgi:Relaxase/Mobilisation nuclease domain